VEPDGFAKLAAKSQPMKQRVLHVIPSVAPARGGPSQAVVEMVQALRQAGVDAEIAVTNDNGPDLLDVPLNQRSTFQDVPVWFFPRFSPSVTAVREFAFSASFTRWLWQNIHQYDLLHVHAIFSYTSTATMTIARHKRVPYIVRPLGQLCHWSLQQSQRKKQFYLKLIEHANLNHAQAIHYTSENERQEALNLELAAPSVIIPHGLTLSPLRPDAKAKLRQNLQLPADEPIVLFLSRLHLKKGLNLLIAALSQLQAHRFTFVLAGSGDPHYEDEIRQQLISSGISDRTCMVGFVNGEQKDLLLQGSDLFVLTSYSENFGVAVLEALAAGLPAIVTPGVALAEVVEHHQLGAVPELEEGAIATAILQALNQPETMKAMGDRARQLVLNHYTWDRVAAQLIEVYTAILEKKPANGPLSQHKP
jgi:glycosyltransferase involved in cell wall biosynthesis